MIDDDEVRSTAVALDLTEANVQRDYVFGWLLAGVFGDSRLGQGLALKGGNALRKGYFPNTRFSDDLDFTTAGTVDAEALVVGLNDVCRLVEARTGVAFDLDRNGVFDVQTIDQSKRAYKVRLYFKDFISGSDHITLKVRVDVTEHDRIVLPLQSRALLHPYSDAAEIATDITCIKLEEALADKLKCLIQRQYCFDLFDLVYGVFIADDFEVNRTEVVSAFLQKTIFSASPSAARGLLAGARFDKLRGFWGKVIAPVHARFTFDRALELFLTGLDALFEPFGSRARAELAFYPSELRNLILEAGTEQKLLRLRYRSATRLVEPYSLRYKRRRDGVAQEYLFAYDTTGGNSGPRIKMFFHYGIENLELTDIDFDPRFEIELAKAGDATMSGIFTGGRRASSFRTARRAAARYTVVCSACGKRFARTKPGTRLNKHDDQYGYRCFGGVGYYD